MNKDEFKAEAKQTMIGLFAFIATGAVIGVFVLIYS